MSQADPGARRPPGNVVQGMLRLAQFRADGLDCFTPSPAAFINSLSPLLALALVGGLLVLLRGGAGIALGNLLTSLVAMLAPAVLSEGFALLWRRQSLWLRYAIAFNWCQAMVTLAAVAILLFIGGTRAGDALWDAVALAVLVLMLYWLSLHWFITRHGLRVSRLQATVAVIVVNIGTGVLVMLPRVVATLSAPGGAE